MSTYHDRAFDKAQGLLDGGCTLGDLPVELKTVVVITSAQGIIDNGGYRYFFEADWPEMPAYTEFVLAYRRIGHTNAADELSKVIASFPFECPHLRKSEREAFMERNWDDQTLCVKQWGDPLCGDVEVWLLLERYCQANAVVMGIQ